MLLIIIVISLIPFVPVSIIVFVVKHFTQSRNTLGAVLLSSIINQ